MFNKINDETKSIIGQEYFKRKLYRKISEWFSSYLKKYDISYISNVILEKRYLNKDIEIEILNIIPKDNIIKYINEIEEYKASITPDDIQKLIKMIYFHIPEYREALEKSPNWLSEQVTQILIAFDMQIYKAKKEIEENNIYKYR